VDAFWKFHDWMFAHQSEITADGKNLQEKVAGFSASNGLDAATIRTCMETHATAAEVTASEEQGNILGVQQTPTLFVDGRKVEGALPWANLEALFKFELAKPKNIPVPTN
jgi:protein-disulfide isomerase